MASTALLFVSFLAACSGASDSASTDTRPADTLAEDPLAAALGGCTASIDVTVDGVHARTVSVTYDQNGDATATRSEAAEDPALDWLQEVTFGAPHEMTENHVWYPNADTREDDYVNRYTWEDGHEVTEQDDDGADGVLEWDGWMDWQDDQLVAWGWDTDADGVDDDTADFVWTADGDGWTVLGAGEDHNGPYNTEEWWNAALKQTRYHYLDSTGYETRWEVSAWNTLGLGDDRWHQEWIDGDLFLSVTEVVDFDELGRFATIDETSTASDVTEEEVRVFSYDCP